MQTIETLSTALDINTDTMIEQVLNIDSSMFDIQPSDGSWSAAQLTEHLYVSDRVIFNILTGETESTARPADEKATDIKEVMGNRKRNLVAPDVIVPLGKVKDQQLLITKLLSVRKDIYKFIQTADLSLICLGFAHKGFGPMTRLEWIVFMVAHTERHFHQYQKIASTLDHHR